MQRIQTKGAAAGGKSTKEQASPQPLHAEKKEEGGMELEEEEEGLWPDAVVVRIESTTDEDDLVLTNFTSVGPYDKVRLDDSQLDHHAVSLPSDTVRGIEERTRCFEQLMLNVADCQECSTRCAPPLEHYLDMYYAQRESDDGETANGGGSAMLAMEEEERADGEAAWPPPQGAEGGDEDAISTASEGTCSLEGSSGMPLCTIMEGSQEDAC